MIRQAAILAVLAGTCLSGGCFSSDPSQGYSFQSLYPEEVDSVAVAIVQRGKDVYRRDLEFRLTEALKKQIALDTPYRVLPRASADTELKVTIDLVEQVPMSVDPDTGLSRETQVTAVLTFSWVDLKTGRIRRQAENFRVASTYLPQSPFGESFFQGYEDVANKAARYIVEQLEKPL